MSSSDSAYLSSVGSPLYMAP